ncbi:tRNA (N6-threonylcarbamoyladenosine(37)-N6)-methyltransferase TrmO [Halomonas halocynthiae]|uniref:tRNA (N6-threonylcarbamoyladenosine(37)-N6)-methyltransferase TrmO n=1 Tax=Halomonas halocynthiae TaxID=176290 RepID=UPI0003FA66E5|nr:tRNA (N6-threonylcarbamoyladenosine(37)-N6)-methyltransferase TrmO [Halomonas halocynthiae]
MNSSITNNESLRIEPIGHIRSDFISPFGIPRQPGLANAARASLVLTPPYDDPLSVRGLDEFSHIWLTFIFHLSPTRWKPLVRPPRLGGNAKMGVFATRSTHRPNRIGLSLVALEHIDTRNGVTLTLNGADLADGTPVVDIKPYLPWLESKPQARSGFAPEAPPLFQVTFSNQAAQQLAARPDSENLSALIQQVLAQDPRPAYRRRPDTRIHGIRLRDIDVRFRATQENVLEVIELAAI